MIVELVQLVLLAVAVEAVTEILVTAKITDGLRNFIFRKAMPELPDDFPDYKDPPRGTVLWSFLHDLLSCGYCTSVWVAMPAAALAPWLFGWWVVNFGVMVFVLHRLSNWLHVVYSIVKKGRIKTYDIELTQRGPNHGSAGQIGGP